MFGFHKQTSNTSLGMSYNMYKSNINEFLQNTLNIVVF